MLDVGRLLVPHVTTMTKRGRISAACVGAAVMLAVTVSARSDRDRNQEARLERRVCALAAPSSPYYAFFQDIIRSQFHRLADSDGHPVLLLTSFPQRIPQTADFLLVDDTGQVSVGRQSYDRAPYESVVKRLDPEDLLNFRARLEWIRPSFVTPPLNRLVLFSFVRHGVWCTYSFDAERLPKSYFAALDLLRLPVVRPV